MVLVLVLCWADAVNFQKNCITEGRGILALLGQSGASAEAPDGTPESPRRMLGGSAAAAFHRGCLCPG